MNSKRPAVFVDRDNTLIHDPGYLRHADHVRLLPGIGEAVDRLRHAGLPVVVVTNQSGIARGYLTEAELDAVHQRMQELLHAAGSGVDAIYYCPFLTGPDAVVEKYCKESELRKPKPGMLMQAAKDMNLDLRASWMIGDSERDIQAGQAAGCRTILIGNGNIPTDSPPDFTASGMSKAADIILREMKQRAAKPDAPAPEKKVSGSVSAAAIPTAPSGVASVQTPSPKPPATHSPASESPSVAAPAHTEPVHAAHARHESRPTGRSSAAASSAVKVADPNVRILEPSKAAAHRNVVETDADRPKHAEATIATVKADPAPPIPQALDPQAPVLTAPVTVAPEAPSKPARPETENTAETRSPVASLAASSNSSTTLEAVAMLPQKSSAADVASSPVAHVPEHLRVEIPRAAPEPTLGQVLEEIRMIKREQNSSDFSFTQLTAAVAQALAVCSLGFGFYASINGDATAASFRLLLAIAFQLMAMTGFLVSRK